MQRPRRFSRVPLSSSSWPSEFGLTLRLSLLLLILTNLALESDCYGTFELQILEIENPRGEVVGGDCCGTIPRRRRVSVVVVERDRLLQQQQQQQRQQQQQQRPDNQSGSSSPCPVPCRTYFRVCLREYQINASVAAAASCSYGNASSPVLGPNSFTLADPDRANGKLSIRFKFSWTRAFTLLLEAFDAAGSMTPTTFTSPGGRVGGGGGGSGGGGGKLIERATYSGIILPSAEWHTLSHHGLTAKITYRIRVQCDKYYYDHTCMKFCRPRDDKFGHFTCDPLGNKECIAGWQGANCEKAVCKTGCHREHGKCDYPGDCECRPGWKGEFCDQCQPYPDCKHGYCNAPYECICDTNWGGILCDKDLNYCGTHEPCLNGGTCNNTAPDHYFCACADGFSGSRCEVVTNPCATAPCSNGSTCVHILHHQHDDDDDVTTHFRCICPPGWTGTTCHTNVNDCVLAACFNGGTCVDLVGGYACSCPANWSGDRCELDVDECETTRPCVNAVSCQNTPGDYRCECQKGWTGKNCDQNVDDCAAASAPCSHAATCIDLVDDYYCACAPGFTGKMCEIETNECAVDPCKNGGECVDMVNEFRCICPVGFTGDLCQTNYDYCNPNPCRNNARCLNAAEDYYCHCTQQWRGKNCSEPKRECGDGGGDGGDDSSPSICNVAAVAAVVTTVNSSPCEPNPCNNGGTCASVEAKAGTEAKEKRFSCLCDARFEGERCQAKVGTGGGVGDVVADNYCGSSPCSNGGECVNGVNWFLCVCAAGFTGADCRININECASDPCAYGATCVDRVGHYQCLCPPHRAGFTCEIARIGENYLTEGLNWVAITAAIALPVTVSAGIIFLLIVYCRRRRRPHQRNSKREVPFQPNDFDGPRPSHIRTTFAQKDKPNNIAVAAAATKHNHFKGFVNEAASMTKVNVVRPIFRREANDVDAEAATSLEITKTGYASASDGDNKANDATTTLVVTENRHDPRLLSSSSLACIRNATSSRLLVDGEFKTTTTAESNTKDIIIRNIPAAAAAIPATSAANLFTITRDTVYSQNSSPSPITTILPNVFV